MKLSYFCCFKAELCLSFFIYKEQITVKIKKIAYQLLKNNKLTCKNPEYLPPNIQYICPIRALKIKSSLLKITKANWQHLNTNKKKTPPTKKNTCTVRHGKVAGDTLKKFKKRSGEEKFIFRRRFSETLGSYDMSQYANSFITLVFIAKRIYCN